MERVDVLKRVLILPPTRKDGEVTSSLLVTAGLSCLVLRNLRQLAQEVRIGAGVILLTEQVMSTDGIEHLLQVLTTQPTWSNVPVVMLIKELVNSPGATRVLRGLRNVTLLERPAPTRSVVSAVQAALRGREWQYTIRDQLDDIRTGQKERQRLLESERAARAESDRANRMKDEFLATLSHELRTPLNAILGWAQIIKMSPRNEEAVLEGINVIDRNVRLQAQLIEDLLDMSRIISGKVRLDIRHVALAEVIEAALQSVLPAIAAKGIRLEKVVDPSVGSISGDPGRLQQVFWNLLANAIKFTNRGGTIRVRAERVQSHLEISVSDTGEGIAPEFLPHLFERFTQADGSTTRTHGGLGLGLSIVSHLVEMHGGTVNARSEGIGKGATFVIQFPQQVTPADPNVAFETRDSRVKAKDFRDREKIAGLKVLIVDDEADARELVRRFLSKYGAVAELAASAAQAHLMLATFKPDVIVSDIGMPVEDGYAFMKAVRGLGLKTPALALTAFARSEDRVRSVQAGFQMHLSKPVDPIELVTAIASLAGRLD